MENEEKTKNPNQPNQERERFIQEIEKQVVDTDNAKDFQRLLREQIISRHAKRPLNDTKDQIDNTKHVESLLDRQSSHKSDPSKRYSELIRERGDNRMRKKQLSGLGSGPQKLFVDFQTKTKLVIPIHSYFTVMLKNYRKLYFGEVSGFFKYFGSKLTDVELPEGITASLFTSAEDIEVIESISQKRKKNNEISDRFTGVQDSFPFLELPIELQFSVIEQFLIGELLTLRCVCKYFTGVTIPSSLTKDLPNMGIWKFLDKPVGRTRFEPQCKLTVIATPTVFHFGLVTDNYYLGSITGYERHDQNMTLDMFTNVLVDLLEQYVKEDGRFKYDTKKLKEFLLDCKRMNRKIRMLTRSYNRSRCTVYVELDSHFGIGIEFRSPGDPSLTDNDW